MSTITTNFHTAPVRRSHATRFADGVIAGYIHAVAGAPRVASAGPRARSASADEHASYIVGQAAFAGHAAAAESVDAAIEAKHAHAPRQEGRPRKSACWSRGGRVGHVVRAQRQLEAR